jgi:hypothetical protein
MACDMKLRLEGIPERIQTGKVQSVGQSLVRLGRLRLGGLRTKVQLSQRVEQRLIGFQFGS